MSDATAIKKQLKIKAGATLRLAKEKKLYAKEVGDLEIRLEGLKVKEGVEEWDIKNATKLIGESKRMVEDVTKRLDGTVADLEQLIDGAKDHEEVVNSEEFTNAQKVLAEAKAE